MTGNSVFVCASCGQDVSASLEGEPCPSCGNTERIREIRLEDTVKATESLSGEITFADDKYWWEPWMAMSLHADNIAAWYASSPQPNSGPFQVEVDQFFLECHRLVDWLIKDDVHLPRITKSIVERHVNQTLALRRARAVANTLKHMRLNEPHYMTFRKKNARFIDSRMMMDLEFSSGNLAPVTVDVLALVRECEQAWQEFLNAHGIQP